MLKLPITADQRVPAPHNSHTTMQDVKLGEAGGGIDIIDFAPFLNGTGKQAVADAILESFRKIGFVYLTNHGIAQEKVDDMFAWVSCEHIPTS